MLNEHVKGNIDKKKSEHGARDSVARIQFTIL